MADSKIEERQRVIFHELGSLNQFIVINENRLLNILNGCEVSYKTGEYIFMRWELVDVGGKDVESKAKVNRLELHNTEKYLKTMKAQSNNLD